MKNNDLQKVYHWVLEGDKQPFENKKMIKLLDLLIFRIHKAIEDLED